ncbi:MAG: endo-1,4-beta-xylanase [Ignavibacteria bacterium]|nr:endo-1,4-beta-xylanase [Ignavibacteria bacterium]
MITLLLCLTGLLPNHSFAQPLAKGKDKFLGCATNSFLYRNLALYWNQVTPGNDGKWGRVESSRGQYNWTNLDLIYDFATQRNIPFKHHVLVWGSQQPSWIAGLDSANQRAAVESWIRAVGQRYTKTSFVDVVNEPFHPPLPSYKNALGGDGTTGWDWVITAFQLARQYCAPGVKLHLNEYNVLHSNTATTNYLTVINLLKDRGLIDGIGVQGHYFEFRSDMSSSSSYVYDIATIKANLNRLTATGLPVYITEFDIDEPNDANQLAQYKIYFPIFWTNPGVKGITLWGYIDGDIWTDHPNTYLIRYDGSERPALQWLRNYILSPQPPAPISPVAAVGIQRNPVLVWHSSDSATLYHVQLSDNSVFATFIMDTTIADTLLQLKPLDPNSRFYWRVSAANTSGTSDYSGTASFITGDLISAAEELGGIPSQFELSQNYPNPFNPSTAISFQLPAPSGVEGSAISVVTLRIFDVLGRDIAMLVNGERAAGRYTVRWDGTNENGESVTSGMYLYQLRAGTNVSTKKMVFVK